MGAKNMKILCVSDRDFDGDCGDWLIGDKAQRVIDEGFTHIISHFEGSLCINEVSVIPFTDGTHGVLLGEDV